MKNKFIIPTIIGITALIIGISVWYFGFYKPKKDFQKSQENMILAMASQQYKDIFGSDKDVYQKCQQITSSRNNRMFTTQDIERRRPDCECTVHSVKKMIIQMAAENVKNAINGPFDEEAFKKGTENRKKNSDYLIEIALDGCQMESNIK